MYKKETQQTLTNGHSKDKDMKNVTHNKEKIKNKLTVCIKIGYFANIPEISLKNHTQTTKSQVK